MSWYRRWMFSAVSLALVTSLLPLGGGSASAAEEPPPPAVFNPGFEEADGLSGWTRSFGVGIAENTAVASTAEKYEGARSLLLDDRSAVHPLGMESTPFAVTPAAGYSVSAMMKVETGSMALYIRFFDANGTKIGEAANWLTPTDGAWAKNAVSAVVPDKAVTGTVLLYSSGAGVTRGYADAVGIEPNRTGTFERIGGIVKGMINEDSAIGSENGKPVLYSVFKGRGETPTVFAVIDALSREVLGTYPMPGVEAAWGVKVATDGQVYIGTHYNGGLYRYNPGTKQFDYLGQFGSETHVFSMVAGPNGKIFAGTYPGGRLYEYDPAAGAIQDLGRPDPEEKYLRSLAYDAERNVLYAGAGGTKSRIYKIGPDGSKKGLLSTLIPGGGDSYAWPYGMDFEEDRLFVKFSNGDLLVVRPDDTIDYYDPAGMDIHSGQVAAIPGQPGRVLFTLGANFYAYDSASRSSELVAKVEGGVNFQDGRFVDLQSPEWPGQTFVGLGSYGNVMYYNQDTGRTAVQPVQYEGAPILIQSIHQGTEGKIYAAGYMSGFTSYDPATGAVSETNPLGQIESSAIRNGKLLLGAYAGGRVLEYDPNQPFSAQNPRQLFDLRAYDQDRPFAMVYDEEHDRLFVGTVPNTTSLQGALAMYDFATGRLEVFRNLALNQSVISLAYKDGLVYVGTTVYGGLGTSGPTETNAKLVVFDPATKRKVFETIPVSGRKGVTGLTIAPDGSLWGVAEDMIFKFDTASRKVVSKIAKLRRYSASGTTWTWGFLRFAPDGNLYGTSRGQFFMVKPETLEFVMLNGSYGNYLNIDASGHLYFSDNDTTLWKYTPPGMEPADEAPPVTTASLQPSEPNGENGWHTVPVTVQLEATDDRSGVTETVYSLDQGASWQRYTSPLAFTQDGVYAVQYRSSDQAGHTEDARTLAFRLDRTPPVITVASPVSGVHPDSEELDVQVEATDEQAGVDAGLLRITLDGQPVQPGEKLSLYLLPLGTHTLHVTAVDLAGNRRESTATFETRATQESLLALLARFGQSGQVSQPGILNSLVKKAEHADWAALVHEVEALSGKQVAADAASILLRDARALLTP
ncbi:hypothetical protein J31TS4_22420 [Paenibacillus sp. J31TS4]|uniref:OmpL47-type beta-barrel domain-containing protein n=1 Tax=Paenibacillus sp. J31TS4 TaxID=2807195 RepID=UPI001B28F085|nr:hypothetical protein [Paenibacillus sp. J31TS4]GIP38962.1 hypothetical protein J31TS4_22420 [Paenibacillus sp. J31TS4]